MSFKWVNMIDQIITWAAHSATGDTAGLVVIQWS
jgi:hypothetical protein